MSDDQKKGETDSQLPSNVRLFPTSRSYTNGRNRTKTDATLEASPQRFPRWLILTAYVLIALTGVYIFYGLVQALRR